MSLSSLWADSFSLSFIMTASRIHQLYANYLGDQTVLESPAEILGPNHESLLDFWKKLDEQVLRTEFDGSFEVYSCHWGNYLRPCRDPLANAVITQENLDMFEVSEDVHKIPSDIWTAWILLCFHFVDKVPAKMEVLVRFLRNEEDPSKFMAVIPKQSVTSATAKSGNFDNCCNLLTGEKYTSYPPEGWVPIGSSHSHNTMFAGWSGEDDKYEIPDPGFHATVGEINLSKREYKIAASVTANLKRFKIDFNKLIDMTWADGVNFHENVLEYVETSSPTPVTTHKTWPTYVTHRKQRSLPLARNTFVNMQEYYDFVYGQNTDVENVSDPFYFNENSSSKPPTDVHQIIDLIDDFIKQNRNDSSLLEEFQNQLSSCLIDLQIKLQP